MFFSNVSTLARQAGADGEEIMPKPWHRRSDVGQARLAKWHASTARCS